MNLDQRITRLERAMRLWRTFAIAVACLAFAALLPAMMRPAPVPDSFGNLNIVDSAGKAMAQLGVNDKDKPCLWFYGDEGDTASDTNRRLFLGVSNENQAYLQFYNDKGEPCHYMTAAGTGEGEYESHAPT